MQEDKKGAIVQKALRMFKIMISKILANQQNQTEILNTERKLAINKKISKVSKVIKNSINTTIKVPLEFNTNQNRNTSLSL